MTKINYKGTSCRGCNFIYICECGEEKEVNHSASKKPLVVCAKCEEAMHKKPTALAFDADHHDSMLSHNLGWESDEKK